MSKKKNPLYEQWFGSKDSHPNEHDHWRHSGGHRKGEQDAYFGFGEKPRSTSQKGLMFRERRGKKLGLFEE